MLAFTNLQSLRRYTDRDLLTITDWWRGSALEATDFKSKESFEASDFSSVDAFQLGLDTFREKADLRSFNCMDALQ